MLAGTMIKAALRTMVKAPEVEASAGRVGRQADRQAAAKPNTVPIRLPAAPAVTP